MIGRRVNLGRERHWEKMIREAARSGMSISEFCRRRHLKEKQFYWWRRRLGKSAPHKHIRKDSRQSEPSFALVSDQPGALDAGIELLLEDGRRLRICKGVDEETLRAVLAAVES
jgi:hypothetical protein